MAARPGSPISAAGAAMFTLNSKREGTMRYPNSPVEEPSIVNRRPTMFHCVLKYLESVANKLPGEVHQRAELLEWQLWGGHFGAITVRSWPGASLNDRSLAARAAVQPGVSVEALPIYSGPRRYHLFPSPHSDTRPPASAKSPAPGARHPRSRSHPGADACGKRSP
jgi:hypothetical protein